jgi:hypothetical protein
MSQWLLSSKARKLFSYSSWTVVCVGFFMLFMLTPWFQQIEASPRGDLFLRILASPLGILGAPAALIIWFGMVAFCVSKDRSSTATKILWFVLFFVAACFASAAYYFRVYRKQVEETPVPA